MIKVVNELFLGSGLLIEAVLFKSEILDDEFFKILFVLFGVDLTGVISTL